MFIDQSSHYSFFSFFDKVNIADLLINCFPLQSICCIVVVSVICTLVLIGNNSIV